MTAHSVAFLMERHMVVHLGSPDLQAGLNAGLAGTAGMPFKSQAQRRKFAELLVQGKISNKTFEEWNRETGGKKLPERVTRKRAATRKKR